MRNRTGCTARGASHSGSLGRMGEEPVRRADPVAESESERDRDFVARAARRAIIGAVAAAVVFALIFVLKGALTPLAAAFVIAYLLDPIIDRFEARRVRRSIAIFVLLALFGGAVAGGVLFVLPKLQREITALAERMPDYLDRLTTVAIPSVEHRF